MPLLTYPQKLYNVTLPYFYVLDRTLKGRGIKLYLLQTTYGQSTCNKVTQDNFEASFILRFSNSIHESVKEEQILKILVFELSHT